MNKRTEINNGSGFIKRNGSLLSLTNDGEDLTKQHSLSMSEPYVSKYVAYRGFKDFVNIRVYAKPTNLQLDVLCLIKKKVVYDLYRDEDGWLEGRQEVSVKEMLNHIRKIYKIRKS